MGVRHRLLLAAVCGVAVASVYVAQPILKPMGRDLVIEPADTGWLVAIGQIGYLIGLVLLVPLGDVVDRRRLIAAQLALTGTGMLVTGCAGSAWVAFAGLGVAGLFAVVVQTTVAYAAAVAPAAERGRTIGIVTSGVVIGILGGRVLAGVLAQAWQWRGVYVVLGLAAVLLAAVVRVALPADQRRAGATVPLGGLLTERLFWSRGLIAFFAFASFGTLWSGMALPLADRPWSLGEAQIGLFGLAGLAGALGAARAGRWADAGRARVVTGAALVLLTASWAAIAQLTRSLWLLAAGIVVLDFAVQAAHVSNQHRLTATYPDRSGTVIGAYMVFYSLGSALGAAATTALYSAGGWAASSALGAVFAAGALAAWAIGQPARPRLPAR
ncbi:MFS transporter [Actinoplanes sp. NPDC048988]|uniref:MFS transporter n=1 Tax=Actinoplanes sp. NPDC048988 TaxID=3363901 RepID=UPI003723C1DE